MHNRPIANNNLKLLSMTIILVVFSVTMVILDNKGKLYFIRDAIQTNFSLPIKKLSSWPLAIQSNLGSYFENTEDLVEENQRQKKEISWLKANLINQSVLEAENRRLKLLMDSTAKITRPVSIAEVVDSQIGASRHSIEINKGTKSGAYVDQVVIDENGVVGQLTEAYKENSIVSLITDMRQFIPAFIERNRLRLISHGTGDLNRLELQFIANDADIRVGDNVVTSGLGNRFPRGYRIGVVTSVERGHSSSFANVRAKPYAKLSEVLEVLLITEKEDDILSSSKKGTEADSMKNKDKGKTGDVDDK